MSSLFQSSSYAALHCNLPVLITDHYTSLRWVYQSTRRISLFPVSVAANKKLSLSKSYSQGTSRPILHQLSLLVSHWLWPFDCWVVRTVFFLCPCHWHRIWILYVVRLGMSVQESPNLGSHSVTYSWHPLRKEFTYAISCDILAIQLTFDLMWHLLKFFNF